MSALSARPPPVVQVVVGTLACLLVYLVFSNRSSFQSQGPSLATVEGSVAAGLPYTDCAPDIAPKYGYTQTKFDNPEASPISRLDTGLASLDYRTFECIGREMRTDKVVEHSYEYIYTKYLNPVRLQPLKLLEIGLGCGMAYGAGHSIQVWKRFLPNSGVSILEFDRQCAEPFRTKVEAAGGQLYLGSQADAALLAQVTAEAREQGLYDVIIDDGKHDSDMQLTSLLGLWPAVKPGGIYVVEDVFKHYQPEFESRTDTFMHYLTSRLLNMINCRTAWRVGAHKFSAQWNERCDNATDLERQVLTVDCTWEACVLVKDVYAPAAAPAAATAASAAAASEESGSEPAS